MQITEIDATDETAPYVAQTYRGAPSEPIATRPLALSLWTREGTVRETLYYAHDLRKNVVSLFDGNGLRRASYQYDPYGNITSIEGDMARENPYRFSSEHHDEDLGLVYYNYRHYNPTDGRWISRDPIAEQGGWNLYGFVNNNAMRFFDDLGSIPVVLPLLMSIISDVISKLICHIWVYAPKNRNQMGHLFLYDHNRNLQFVSYPLLKGTNRNTLITNGDTPLGTYIGVIDVSPCDSANGSIGAHPVLRLSAREYQENKHPKPLDGDAKKAFDQGRRGLLVHGGRKNGFPGRSNSKPQLTKHRIYDIKSKTYKNDKVLKPCSTHGCIRNYEDEQKKMIDKMISLRHNCKAWVVHVTDNPLPIDPSRSPYWWPTYFVE